MLRVLSVSLAFAEASDALHAEAMMDQPAMTLPAACKDLLVLMKLSLMNVSSRVG